MFFRVLIFIRFYVNLTQLSAVVAAANGDFRRGTKLKLKITSANRSSTSSGVDSCNFSSVARYQPYSGNCIQIKSLSGAKN